MANDMSERRWYKVTGTSGFKPGIWRWQRGEVLVMLSSLGMCMIVFRLLSSVIGFPTLLSLSLAALIPVGVTMFLLCLVTGKPRNYALDAIEWLWMRLAVWLVNHGFRVSLKPLIEIRKHERKF